MQATRFKYCPLVSSILCTLIGISAPRAQADLLVASRLGSAILAYDETTGAFLRTFASDPSLDGPAGMTYGPDGNLYVSSNFANSVVRFNGTTGEFIDTFASGGGLARPTG